MCSSRVHSKLHFNTHTLANTQGEIRVGPSHQAKLPLLKVSSPLDAGSLREELLWKNSTNDLDLSVYLQAARSIAAFAGMCDRGLPEDMYEVAQRDDTTINALTILHKHQYDCKRAIQALVKCPIPKGIDRKWSDDDQKKFIKGLRQYGKNFFRIRKDLLPHKQTSDLVEFYYLWKKTPQAQSNRPRRRQRPCSTLASASTTPQRSTKSNNRDESDEDNPINGELDEQSCRHCQTSSKDLQIIGRDNQLFCYECRMYYKRYGEMPSVNLDSSPYLFKPLNETSASAGKRKRTKPSVSPDDENSLWTRSRKKTRSNEKLPTIKTEIEDDAEEIIIKKEEQENEKPSSIAAPLIKTEELTTTILTPTPCKQERHSPSSMLTSNTPKILIDHTKQNNSNVLLSSPSSAFSRTSRKSLAGKDSNEFESLSKLNTTIDGEMTSSDPCNDDGNISDSSSNTDQEAKPDDGTTPIVCEKECYNKSQGIVLLQTYDRSTSQNSCARTDIVLKRGSRTRQKPSELQEVVEITPATSTTKANIKQEERTPSKFAFSLDKGPPILHPPYPHSDPLLMNHNNPLFHPLSMHAFGGVTRPPLGFPSPFGPPHENAALRHLDPLGLRMINPGGATMGQLFAGQSPFSNPLGRPTPANLDPTTAALLLDPRYRSMIPPLPSSSDHSSPMTTHNGTHNHAHIHSHSHTHLHLNNSNESSSSSGAGSSVTNGSSLPPPPLLPFANPLSGNPLLHPGGPFSPSSLEAMHNLTRERELMALMFANNNRFDPMTLALANSLQMPRLEDLARQRSLREHNENELRRLNLEMERQHFRLPFHHTPDELLRRY